MLGGLLRLLGDLGGALGRLRVDVLGGVGRGLDDRLDALGDAGQLADGGSRRLDADPPGLDQVGGVMQQGVDLEAVVAPHRDPQSGLTQASDDVFVHLRQFRNRTGKGRG